MLAVYRACEVAGVDVPSRVLAYFDHCRPNPDGMTQDITHHACCVDYRGDDEHGFTVDVEQLPPGTRFVRFYCSY